MNIDIATVIQFVATHFSYADKQQCLNALELLDFLNADALSALGMSTNENKMISENEMNNDNSLPKRVVQFVAGDMNTYLDFEWSALSSSLFFQSVFRSSIELLRVYFQLFPKDWFYSSFTDTRPRTLTLTPRHSLPLLGRWR